MSVLTEDILYENILTEQIQTEDILIDIAQLETVGNGSIDDITSLQGNNKSNSSKGTAGDSTDNQEQSYEDEVNENLAYDISKSESLWVTDLWERAKQFARDAWTAFLNSELVQNIVNGYTENAKDGVSVLGKYVNGVFGAINETAAKTVGKGIEDIMDSFGAVLDGANIGEFGETLSNIGDIVSGLLQPYGTGEYPGYAESAQAAKDTWNAAIANGGTATYVIKQDTNPFEISPERFSIYGKLILGAPFIFGESVDPTNRSLFNTIIKDSRILSLTPGLPKYNGGQILTTANKAYDRQVTTFDEMLAYALQSRINVERQSKDTRYYTFEAKYNEYYEYLEAALQTIYLKMGLSTRASNMYDLLKVSSTVKESSLGFFINQVNLSENINSRETNIGSGMASDVNGSSSRFQELNYLTGFGNTAANQTRRIAGIASESLKQVRTLVGDIFENTTNGWNSGSGIGRIIKAGVGLGLDVAKNVAFTDVSNIAERFTVTNGMKIMYPELWSDSTYSRSISIDFSFTSPYGDPASIFKYVYLPYFALLTFAMPRQASHNGLISPFFVRACVPGMFNSDLALVSDITWNRGGSAGMWTKDGLPRQINGSITITDLYPYLASVNSMALLSFNPQYTTWLDTFSGQRAIYSENDNDPMGNYFKQMINNLSGLDNGVLNSGLWNRYSQDEIAGIGTGMKASGSIYTNTNNKSIIWMNKI